MLCPVDWCCARVQMGSMCLRRHLERASNGTQEISKTACPWVIFPRLYEAGPNYYKAPILYRTYLPYSADKEAFWHSTMRTNVSNTPLGTSITLCVQQQGREGPSQLGPRLLIKHLCLCLLGPVTCVLQHEAYSQGALVYEDPLDGPVFTPSKDGDGVIHPHHHGVGHRGNRVCRVGG